jgi:V/A-type H+-transporting ATPase subunit E
MAETIETFVQKLQTEGVQAGKQEASRLTNAAQTEADRILADAKEQAEKILADAQAESHRMAERQRSELDLALRDAVLRFRKGVNQAIASLLDAKTSEVMSDEKFLVSLIHDVVVQYAQADAGQTVTVNVNPKAMDAVADWAMKYVGHGKSDGDHGRVDLRGNLRSVGFEYSVSESTVEVTVDSIVEVLKGNMSPRLRETLDRALQNVAAQR